MSLNIASDRRAQFTPSSIDAVTVCAQSLPPNITENRFHVKLLMCCQIIGLTDSGSSSSFSFKCASKLSIKRNMKSKMEIQLSEERTEATGDSNPSWKPFLINHLFIITHFHSADLWMETLRNYSNQIIDYLRSSHLISRNHNSRLWLPFSNQSNLCSDCFRAFQGPRQTRHTASNHNWLSRWCPIKKNVKNMCFSE